MKKNPPIVQYIVLSILFIAACAYQVRATIFAFPGFLDPQAAAWPFVPDYSNGQPKVEFAHTNTIEAGIHNDDVITAVNGRPFTGLAVYGEEISKAKPGELFEVTVRSPNSTAERTIGVTLPAPPRQLNWAVALVGMLKIVLPVFSILLGFWVAFVRPRDLSAWLLLGVLLGLCNIYSAGTESWGPGIRDIAEFYRFGCNSMWPVFMLYFGLYFPEPFPPSRGYRWIRIIKIVVAPALIADAAVEIIIRLGQIENFQTVARLSAFENKLASVLFALTLAAIGSFFASISIKAGSAVSPDAKRRLRLVYFGSTVAMTPTFVLTVIAWFKHRQLEQMFPEWLVLGSLALLLLFPITLAYTIVVQRALDVRVVIRQGLQYALATRGIAVLQIALTGLVIVIGTNFARRQHVGPAQAMTMIGLLVVAILWLRRGARKLRAWTDRRFFRDAYNSEQILAGLSDEVRTMVETRPLLERVASRIAESLHVPRIAILLLEDGAYRPAYAVGYVAPPMTELPGDSATIEHFRKEPEPARVYFDDENSWVNSVVPEGERRELAALLPQLFLPLSVKGKLLGIISLGEKRSEEPYSGNDLRLLKSVATQTGLALANSQLTSAIAVEVSRREKMSRELEIAREVQERLFPQKLPAIAGLDYFGRCRTALGVGGDYYDYLALPDGKLGIALGDVSGKGIAAALLMASLEASLRAEAMRAGNDLAGMIERVNNLVYDASSEDRYATLFYAQYDSRSRHLAYVNAGHCAPMLFRKAANNYPVTGGAVADGSVADGIGRLDQAGGPVVGLMPGCRYEQAEIALAPGDVIVIFTDGISEAMNLSLEEWGEKRLSNIALNAKNACAEEMIARIIDAADAFAAGAPQHDDMTIVILRVLEY